jgi:hypothetical protein
VQEFGLFFLSASIELPLVVIWKDIKTDLGGWTEYDSSVLCADDTKKSTIHDCRFMRGKYICPTYPYSFPIRLELDWKCRE